MRVRFVFAPVMALLIPALRAAEIPAPDKVDFNFPPAATTGKADFFTIAEDGEVRCCVVIPGKPQHEEVAAARLLETYLRLIAGATVRRCSETSITPGLNQIHVGATGAAGSVPLDLPPARYGQSELPNVNGYLVKTLSPQVLIIRGATPPATLLGAVGLLKRFCGIRRYWPGEPGGIGDVVPKAATLRLPEIEWRNWPYFISRTMSGCDDRGPRGELAKTTRFYDFWQMNPTIPSNESYYRLMNAREHANEPELFPLINGKRYVPPYEPGKPDPNGWQPCVSNSRVAELMAASIKEFFRQNPGKFALNLAVNDGYGDCTCEACRALDAPGADPINRVGLCDRYVTFDNRVAELVAGEFPDRILAFLAYGSMSLPPTTVKLHPMLMPVLCVGRNTFQMWDDWAKMGTKHMGVYWYHDDVWFIMPKVDIHQSAKRIRYLVGSGLARHFYQEFYGVYPLDGMVGYIEQELIWDPRLDEDKLLAEYYAKFFGKAAAPMQAFYDTLEAGYSKWLASAGLPHPYGPDVSSITDSKSLNQFSVLPVELAAQAQGHLQSAVAAAGDDSQAQARIRLVKQLFDFAVLGSRLYWAGERLRAPAAGDKVLADAREAVDSGLTLADYKFSVMEQPAVKDYSNHGDRDTFYCDLQKAVVHAEILSLIAGAFTALAKPEAWWREQRQAEPRPILGRLMDLAAFDAGSVGLVNVVTDPSFEARAASQPASTEADARGHMQRSGVNVWASSGTPMSCALTTEEAHTGKCSFVFWDTQRAGVSEQLAVKEGDCVRMSVWVKHNERKATYVVQTDPRGAEGMLARSTVPVPWKPGEWQKLEVLYIGQPGVRTVSLWLFVQTQSPGARVWADDFFIGKYPD